MHKIVAIIIMITIIVVISIHHGSNLAGQTLLSLFSTTGDSERESGNCGQSIVTAASECMAQLPDSLPPLGNKGGIYRSC